MALDLSQNILERAFDFCDGNSKLPRNNIGRLLRIFEESYEAAYDGKLCRCDELIVSQKQQGAFEQVGLLFAPASDFSGAVGHVKRIFEWNAPWESSFQDFLLKTSIDYRTESYYRLIAKRCQRGFLLQALGILAE